MLIEDYINLVTSEYAQQPNFLATISIDVGVPVQVQLLLASMIPIFDLSTPPVGNQLDIIGQWAGVSRNVSIPITGVFFTWDGTAALGWDSGTWSPTGSPTNITSLPDDAYLVLILGKIAANNWDGTTNGAYAIFDQLFLSQGINILIQDFENMSYAMVIVGATIPALTLALITGGYIPLRPEGVEITDYFVSPGPVFAWDTDSVNLQGWDTGLWATQVPPT
jgi:Protein of unknown function (DUF2612)